MIRRIIWGLSASVSVLTILVSGALAGYFLWRSSSDSGAACTFDNFDCARNRDFATGVRWLMLLVLVLALSIAAWMVHRRRKRLRSPLTR